MAKNEQILRLKFIEEFLRKRKEIGASYEEIADYLEQKFSDKDIDDQLKFTKRTFARDKEAISEILGIEIAYSRKNNAYYIHVDEIADYQETIFDQILLIEAYRATKDNADIMLFEPQRARGFEHLQDLIHAIHHKKIISFVYQKFFNSNKIEKTLCPYALKEFKKRWYLLATEFQPKNGETYFKTFGLDRISDLKTSNTTFKKGEINTEEAFINSFGIISTNGKTPIEIHLEFDAEQANYVKALPLHHSQKIVFENENHTIISLNLVPTYDFQREILSFGKRVKILSPDPFIEEMKKEIQLMFYATPQS